MIKPSKCKPIARTKKQNEIIKFLNPLLKIELVEGNTLSVAYSDNNVVLTIPTSAMIESYFEVGQTGSHTMYECDGTTEVFKLEWTNGLITNDGDTSHIVGDCYTSATTVEDPPTEAP